MPPRIPTFLRSLAVLRALNVAAVGLALGAAVASVFGPIGLYGGPSSLLVGSFWAWLLRSRKTFTARRIPVGWALSVPLAALNSALAAGAMFTGEHGNAPSVSQFFGGMLMGATFGAIIWVPALLATLVAFGLPIRHARRLAMRGLAGEERGELILGVVCAVISLGALVGHAGAGQPPWGHAYHWGHAVDPAQSVLVVLGLLGAATSLLAVALAFARELRRRAFVARAATGSEPGFRVDATTEGNVLVRITAQGEGYRVADFEERLASLGDRGEITRVAL